MSDIFSEYCFNTRISVMEKFNLSRKQCNILVKAYDDIAVIGGLLFRSDIEKEDIRYFNKDYESIPRIMRGIITKIEKDDFYKYFSPLNFSKYFERFVSSVLSKRYEIRSGADILGVGVICYKKQKSINFTESEFK